MRFTENRPQAPLAPLSSGGERPSRTSAGEQAKASAIKRLRAGHRREKRVRRAHWREALVAMMPVESVDALFEILQEARIVVRQGNQVPAAAGFLASRILRTQYTWWWGGQQVTASDAPDIWLETWREANRQVVQLGGQRAGEPRVLFLAAASKTSSVDGLQRGRSGKRGASR